MSVSQGLQFNRQPVSSSNIRSVGWIKTKIMEVEFNNGGVYRYYNVPQEVYQALISASSVGGYLHRHIKPNYPYKKVWLC